ncbi:7-carboxy-7-deazaguanine synthase QueE [Streptomyces sp. H27-H5]|uniref:7-carboxy-7-deazaguanine synthase QueE n=1 Tax=Streptomyces sp. H27-H5 TaxID=2996460 RepID=UPI00226D4B46|nr:7-carboxy-7-deazaguanine synthase QueE [Streptomyces sp. H27-H5]MCY0957722.1 7-carboxy-7-deazaguanine synthase QueE [Streptomyces sp. H27-H5]
MTDLTVSLDHTLVTRETFGPTIQGEGPSTGRRCGFVRLGGCNLTCNWCDTPETWDASRFDLRATLTRRTVRDIVTRALEGDPDLIVITGGEPLLHQQQDGWLSLLAALRGALVEVEVETNGTQAPNAHTTMLVTRFNVSPKLAHAGDPASKRIRPEALRALAETGKAAFKFVCQAAADVAEVTRFTEAHDLDPARVWVMPEGTDVPTLSARMAEIADPAILAGFNVSNRLHVAIWGDEKGR